MQNSREPGSEPAALTNAHTRDRPPHAKPFVAVVYGWDGELFAETASNRDDLVSRLGDYVRMRADVQLWPGPARTVHALLARGRVASAVIAYFSFVGSRWDEEWLISNVFDVASRAT
jgi:hypothetical protein